MERLTKKQIFRNGLRAVSSFSILFTLVMTLLPQISLGWDAGTESRRHTEGTGGGKYDNDS